MRPQPAPATGRIMHGDCIKLMRRLDTASIDFALTDPPYLVRYRDRTGRTVRNDDNGRWLQPTFTELHRVLKDGSFCLSFYGWNEADRFIGAWRNAVPGRAGLVLHRQPPAPDPETARGATPVHPGVQQAR